MTPCDPPCDPLWRTGPSALVEERVDLDGGREEQASHVGRRLAGGGARPWGPQGLLAVALCSIGGGLLPGSGTIVMIALSTPHRLVLVDCIGRRVPAVSEKARPLAFGRDERLARLTVGAEDACVSL
eukprot:1196368-Prorocentrum_minimum.AAC.3